VHAFIAFVALSGAVLFETGLIRYVAITTAITLIVLRTGYRENAG